MNTYEEKRAARIDRLHARADGLAAEGERRLAGARKIADGIPFGQPILVGHHSERHARRDAERIRTGFTKGFGLLDDARDAERRAKAAKTSTAISSDDPNAPERLRAKADGIAAERAQGVAINKVIRLAKGDEAKAIAGLLELGLSEAVCGKMLTKDFAGRIGVPSYHLSNLSAEERRVRQRLEKLEAAVAEGDPEPIVREGARLEQSDNRVRLIFDGKPPSEIREKLKRSGFRWAPSAGAWQRMAGPGVWRIALVLLDYTNPPATAAPPAELVSPGCACERGSTCDVSHDPATCPCAQCTVATGDSQ